MLSSLPIFLGLKEGWFLISGVLKIRATRVRAVRASEEQWARWVAAAGLAGLTTNAWVRARLDEAAALDEAVCGEEGRL